MKKASAVTLEKLAIMTAKGFGDMHRNFAEVNERFNRVEARLDRIEGRLDSVEGRLDRIEAELLYINRRLDSLEEQGASNTGISREIDQLRRRVALLERRLKTR